MPYDERKVDEAVLAVLYLTAFEHHGLTRAWKSVDWEVMGRLHAQGLIDDPEGKTKSILFTEDGIARARTAAEKLFAPDP